MGLSSWNHQHELGPKEMILLPFGCSCDPSIQLPAAATLFITYYPRSPSKLNNYNIMMKDNVSPCIMSMAMAWHGSCLYTQ